MQPKLSERAAGVLLHLTSLPGPYHAGDLGGAAAFLAFLSGSRQRWWQMLPVNPIGDGDSPYSTISSFAGEPLLLDLRDLGRRGWLTRAELAKPAGGAGRAVNYRASRTFRLARLRTAYARAGGGLARDADFQAFRREAAGWLADYALFGALTRHFGTPDWTTWPAPLRDREPSALAAAERDLADETLFLAFTQYLFDRQWRELRAAALARGIALLGDLPIFVSHRSADVWAHARYFLLGPGGRPAVVAGCPPDAFNADGQLWGNALYDWARLEQDGFQWWLDRLSRSLSMFDAVRLDHFIGFARYWEIPATALTAREGRWVAAPGDAFFAAVQGALGAPQLIAEDLGAVTPEVRALRDKYALPGMKVLQFAFDGSAEASHHLPHRLPAASVVYTGTHDNDTARGWYQHLLSQSAGRGRGAAAELARVQAYLDTSVRTVHWDLLRAAYASQASLAVVPLQDLLGLGSAARMNTPGVGSGNWRYRFQPAALTKQLQSDLAAVTTVFDRASAGS